MLTMTTGQLNVRLLCFLLTCNIAASMKSITYDMPGKECGRTRREVDGLVIHSSHNSIYKDSDCYLRLYSDDSASTSKRFMINIKQARVDNCNVTLQMYFGSDYTKKPADWTLDCNNSGLMKNVNSNIAKHSSVTAKHSSVITTNGRFLTLRLRKTTNVGYKFEIVVTAFETGTDNHCRGLFRCASSQRCIDEDLVCDGVDNCFDNSDEMCTNTSNKKTEVNVTSPSHRSLGTLIGLVIAVCAAVIFACILFIIFCKNQCLNGNHGISAARLGNSDHVAYGDQQPIASAGVYGAPNYYTGYPAAVSPYPMSQTPYPTPPADPRAYPPSTYPPPYPETEDFPTPLNGGGGARINLTGLHSTK